MLSRRTGGQRRRDNLRRRSARAHGVAAESSRTWAARGWGDAAWDSGVGCCEAMGLLARRVLCESAAADRSFLSRSDTAALDGSCASNCIRTDRGRLTKFHARTTAGHALLVKEPELSLLYRGYLNQTRPTSTSSGTAATRRRQGPRPAGRWALWGCYSAGQAAVALGLTIWAKWNTATDAALANLALPSVVVRLEDLRGSGGQSAGWPTPCSGSDVNVAAAVSVVGRLRHVRQGGNGVPRSHAVAKWRRSRHRDDARTTSHRALRKYGAPFRERRLVGGLGWRVIRRTPRRRRA